MALARASRGRRAGSALAAASALLFGVAAGHRSSSALVEGLVSIRTSSSGLQALRSARAAGLYPGGAEALTVALAPSAPADVHEERLRAEVKGVENAAHSEAEALAGAKCWPGWFQVGEARGPGLSHVGAKAARMGEDRRTAWLTLKMEEVDGNQDGCEGKKVTLEYSSR